MTIIQKLKITSTGKLLKRQQLARTIRLLVEMQANRSIMGNKIEFPQKVYKRTFVTDPCYLNTWEKGEKRSGIQDQPGPQQISKTKKSKTRNNQTKQTKKKNYHR